MLSFLLIVIVAVLSFLAGRASARPTPRKRDKRGRFVKAAPPRKLSVPTLRLPDIGPQHLAVFGAACLGIGLAMAVPVAMAPVAMLAPLPVGVAMGRRIITPTRSSRCYRTDLARGPATAASMWEDWAC
jgi:hypothetical protein